MGNPPPWRHLRGRLVTLLIEGMVLLRRYLMWLAPFIGLAYIAYDVFSG